MSDIDFLIIRREVDEYKKAGLYFTVNFACCDYVASIFFDDHSAPHNGRISCECNSWLYLLSDERQLEINPYNAQH